MKLVSTLSSPASDALRAHNINPSAIRIGRRALPGLLSLLAVPQPAVRARAAGIVRVGTLRFGTVSWELDVIRRHGLDRAAGVTIAATEFALAQATQVALQAGEVDAVVQDWLWVSRQRASGADWTFAPVSSALGAVVAAPGSPVTSVPDLAGRRLGIAGSPIDKSWLILRAYARQAFKLDLNAQSTKIFGPPPLLGEQLRLGRLDAALTFWPFAARAEAQGDRSVLDMQAALAGLGVAPGLPMLGYVFSAAWAAKQPEAINGFLAAGRQARAILATSDAEWQAIAPLTGAKSPAELALLQSWYRRGTLIESDPEEPAKKLYGVLAGIGGPSLVGPSAHLSAGTFWRAG